MTGNDEEPDRPKRIGCGKCRGVHDGRLLPTRRGWLKCSECRHEVRDRWGRTDDETPGDFASWAQFARQLRATKRRVRECGHRHVVVAVRPWCSDCGLVLDPRHPTAAHALRLLEERGRGAVDLAQQLRGIGREMR